MVSREVNVNRPEHSWIPFYRELAEKLVNEGWREKQGKLMDFMREMALDEGLGVPDGVARSKDPYLDPFSLFASFNNSSRGEKKLLTIRRVRDFFGLESELLHADYLAPEVNSQQMLFFSGVDGYRDDVDTHWNTFEFILDADPFDDATDTDELARLMDASLSVRNVGMAKLSSAFYWLNPDNFLEFKTINGIVGDEVIEWNDDASTYLEGLILARQIDDLSFPKINDEVYLRDHPPLPRPNVWVVRGGRNEHAVNEFRSQNRVGIGFNLGDVNLSKCKTRGEIRDVYREHNSNADNRSVGQNVGQVTNFILDMKVGDYVMMPEGNRVHYGAITSRPYHDSDVSYENSRSMAWYKETVPRQRLSDLPRRRTIAEVTSQLKNEFFAWMQQPTQFDFRIMEDKWVPFHLAVAEKLIDGEWWKPANRGKFGDLVLEVANVAGVIDTETMDGWTPDPYSLYLAFNTASEGPVRHASYEKTRELFGVAADLPERGIYARRYGVFYWSEMRLEETGIDFLWDFFRFLCDADPVNDSDDEAEFVRRFDTALSHDVPGMASATLSQWLYWIDPTKYLLARRIYASELGLAGHLGLAEPIEGGVQYLVALKAVDEFAKVRGMTMLDINRESTTREMLGLEPSVGLGDNAYDVGAMLNEGVFLEKSQIERMIRILRSKQNLILQGPPGVGKTFISRKLAYVLMGEKGEAAEKRITSVQFHQSYSYEDFVGGFRPDVVDGQMGFTRQDGPFLRMCVQAQANLDDDYVMLIDEINRGNLSRVFGELLMLIESDKRKEEHGVTLQHQPERYQSFFVPKNVYIIGTMNLADKSLTGMNVAMRRRFGFYDLEPQFGEPVFKDWLSKTEMPQEMQDRINSNMSKLNTTISKDDSLDFNYAVGHSFFCPPQNEPVDDWDAWYETVVDYEIRPLLREYWFDDPERANGESDKLKKRME